MEMSKELEDAMVEAVEKLRASFDEFTEKKEIFENNKHLKYKAILNLVAGFLSIAGEHTCMHFGKLEIMAFQSRITKIMIDMSQGDCPVCDQDHDDEEDEDA